MPSTPFKEILSCGPVWALVFAYIGQGVTYNLFHIYLPNYFRDFLRLPVNKVCIENYTESKIIIKMTSTGFKKNFNSVPDLPLKGPHATEVFLGSRSLQPSPYFYTKKKDQMKTPLILLTDILTVFFFRVNSVANF